MLPLLLLVARVGAAEPVGHYHPLDVGRASTVFARAQEAAGATFQARQEEAQELARALRAWEEALDLLGDRAPAAERARLAELTKAFGRQRAALSATAQARLDAFDAAFRTALERALRGRPAAECRAGGTGLRMGPAGGRQACPGADLNAELAAAMDRDPALRAAVDDLIDDPWPALALDVAPVAPIGAGRTALDVDAAFRRRAGHALAAVEHADEEARVPFEAAIERGAGKDELAALVSAARQVTERTRARRAALAAPVLDAVDAANARAVERGGEAVAWCAQPAVLGGCTVPPASREVEAALLDEGKVARAWAVADAGR